MLAPTRKVDPKCADSLHLDADIDPAKDLHTNASFRSRKLSRGGPESPKQTPWSDLTTSPQEKRGFRYADYPYF